MADSLHPRHDKAIHQFSFVDALVAGLFEGAFTASEIRRHGTFGLGCEDALDGELVIVDGEIFVCRGDGSVLPLGEHDRLPFAEVAHFEPRFSYELVDALNLRDFDALIAELVPSQNLFYAVRFDGEFDRMTVRDAVRQQAPYRGLADAVKDQHEATHSRVSGTIVGFKGPEVFQGLSVADFHLHFLDDARSFGGHVLDFVATQGTLQIEAFAGFNLHLPQVASYLDAELDSADTDESIRAAEGGR